MLAGAGVTGTLTDDVEQLYDDYPYPAHGVVSSVVAQLAQDAVSRLQERLDGTALEYLDAGCGTGEQTLGMARAYSGLRVTGVDFSERSLSFARDLARRHGLRASFVRKDLTRSLDDIPAPDLITCIGALHHLPSPAAGLRALRGVSKPHTLLLGMVYGTFGKWDLFRVRDALNLLAGPSASRPERLALLQKVRMANNVGPAEYARTWAKRRRFGPRIPWMEAVRRVVGGRSPNYQADAYTHPRETSYTWAEVDELLTSAGWRLVGWPRRSGMPDDPSELLGKDGARLVAELDLLARASIYERLVCPANLYFLAEPRA